MTDADDAGLVGSLRNFIQLNRSMGNHMGIAHSHLVNALQALESQRREIEELRRERDAASNKAYALQTELTKMQLNAGRAASAFAAKHGAAK